MEAQQLLNDIFQWQRLTIKVRFEVYNTLPMVAADLPSVDALRLTLDGLPAPVTAAFQQLLQCSDPKQIIGLRVRQVSHLPLNENAYVWLHDAATVRVQDASTV